LENSHECKGIYNCAKALKEGGQKSDNDMKLIKANTVLGLKALQ